MIDERRLMIRIFPTSEALALAAADHAARSLRDYLARQSAVRLLAATGASQLCFLDSLTSSSGIDWSRVELFHLDEYIGLGIEHPASFARYIKERIVDRTGIRRYHLLDGTEETATVLRNINEQISAAPVDLAFAGIGENGHLAFNDPPADLETTEPYLTVALEERCRRQQVGEGWFKALEEVPTHAFTISIAQLLKSREIVCVVPDLRKAHAVQRCFEEPVSADAPASILRVHPNTHIFLDANSASLLNDKLIVEP